MVVAEERLNKHRVGAGCWGDGPALKLPVLSRTNGSLRLLVFVGGFIGGDGRIRTAE